MSGDMTSIAGRCERSVNGGDYICTLPTGHDGWHRCKSLAHWPDDEAEDDRCAHTATHSLSADGRLNRCDHCDTVLRRIELADDDPGPHVWLTDMTVTPHVTKKVRYEVAGV